MAQHGQSHPRPRTIGIGVVGIGRMGQQHALNLLRRTSSARLLCACSPAQRDLDWGEENLRPYGVSLYSSFDEMVDTPGLEAVIIASATPVHHPQTIACIKRGMHVLCEKPVAETSSQVEEIINVANAHPNVKVMIGFMRRFDDNYLDALWRIQNGEIGQPLIIRSQAYDTLDTSAPYKQYLQNSGGIFLDATIHDIDLALSLFGGDARPKAAWAAGLTAYHKELSAQRDADNAVGICEFHDGKIAFFYNSRTSPRGFDNQTEIVGMNGKISINLLSRQNRLELSDKDGIRIEPTRGWSDRYAESFVTGAIVFTDAVLYGGTIPVTLQDALKSLRIAESLQYSLQTGEKVEFNEDGQGMQNQGQYK